MIPAALPTKALLFGIPLLLTFTGAGVAYHDGVLADDLRDVSKENVGQEVTFKGRVIARDASCSSLDKEMGKDVGCFALRDLDDEHRFVVVATDAALPDLDSIVVVRGTLKFYYETAGGHGSTSWSGGCWDAGKYGSGCWDGGKASWSWPGIALGVVDARSVREPWIVK